MVFSHYLTHIYRSAWPFKLWNTEQISLWIPKKAESPKISSPVPCSAYLWKYKLHKKWIYKYIYIRLKYSGLRKDPPLVLLVTYGMTSSNAYYYTKVMSELFLQTSTDGRVSFQSIGSMADFWVVSTYLACHGEPWNSARLGYSVPSEVPSSDFSKTFCCHKLLPATSNRYSNICMQNIHWIKV